MNMALSEIEKHLKTLHLHGMGSTLQTRLTQAKFIGAAGYAGMKALFLDGRD